MKKRIELYGNLEFPLNIGCAAFIQRQEGGPIRTSAVKHFITFPSGVIYIQTKNTHYVLRPPVKPSAKGVRV